MNVELFHWVGRRSKRAGPTVLRKAISLTTMTGHYAVDVPRLRIPNESRASAVQSVILRTPPLTGTVEWRTRNGQIWRSLRPRAPEFAQKFIENRRKAVFRPDDSQFTVKQDARPKHEVSLVNPQPSGWKLTGFSPLTESQISQIRVIPGR